MGRGAAALELWEDLQDVLLGRLQLVTIEMNGPPCWIRGGLLPFGSFLSSLSPSLSQSLWRPTLRIRPAAPPVRQPAWQGGRVGATRAR